MKVSKKDKFLSLPMSEKMRICVDNLERDNSTHWCFLKAKTSLKLLDDLLADNPITANDGLHYKTTRISNFFVSFYRLFGILSFDNVTKCTKDSHYQIYKLKKADEVKKLVRELRDLIVQTNEG